MVFRRINRKAVSLVDWQLILLMLLLCTMGLTNLHSAGYNPELGWSAPMKRQAMSMGIGLIAFIVCMLINTNFWRRWAYVIYGGGCILLVGILLGGVVAGGARRWLDLGGFRLQPSELTKLGLVLALARVFSRESAPKDGYTLPSLFLPFVVMLIPMGLILDQPDLGTALSHLLIGGSMLLIAGVRLKTFLRLALFAVMLAVPAWNFALHDYQRQRVLTFLSPESDPLGSGYHAMQSKIAVGSGAVTGKGFLKGTQTQLRFLPEQTTDFIFSVLAEEWGFVGSVTIIGLYCLLVLRLLNIGARCTEPFPAFVAFGVAAMIFWHVLVNIGMVVGVVPVVGITLALLSYGGSSIITIMASLGVVAGFSIRRFMFA